MSGQTKGFFEPVSPTPCQCEIAEGQDSLFCNRHQCLKSKHLHSLCKNNRQYFDLWEREEGPNQEKLDISRNPLNKPVTVPTSKLITQEAINNTTGFFEEEKQSESEKGFFEDNEYFMGDEEIPKKSRGLGDPIAKFTKVTGIKKLVKKVVGENCGCSERQAALNRFLPYGSQPKKTKGFFE